MRVADERQLVGRLIEPDTSIRNTRLRAGGSSSTISRPCEADQRQPMLRVPRAVGQLGGHRERRAARRLRIVEVEVVDQLLDAHGVGGRQRPSFRKRRTFA